MFGQAPEPDVPWRGPAHQRSPSDYDSFRTQPVATRPSTSAAVIQTYSSLAEDSALVSPTALRPASAAQVSSPRSGRRYSLVRFGESSSRQNPENARDSASRESWIRRLSLRPLSQHGTSRSSAGPDSSSVAISHGSAVPILAHPPAFHASPNKLVKRATAGQPNGTVGSSRRGSKPQGLTLRRPATSHQRSATLHQLQTLRVSPEPLSPDVKFSLDNYTLSPTSPTSPVFVQPKRRSGKWTSFFHFRRSSSGGRDSPGTSSGIGPYHGIFPRKRVSLIPGHSYPAHLTKPDQIADVPVLADETGTRQDQSAPEHRRGGSHSPDGLSNAAGQESEPRPRRSVSMHFSSASNWIAKTGSVRRPRRNTVDARSGGGRYTPDPTAAPRDQSRRPRSTTPEGTFAQTNARQQPFQQQDGVLEPANLPRTRKRNSSPPLPPLNRLSNIDVTRTGQPISPSAAPSRPLQTPINYNYNSQTLPGGTHSRGPSGERSVTLAGSDVEAREGVSGDEDTDFKSDDIYDSFRTVASSGRVRSVETPLESMFDDSPPSTAGNGRAKRLSIQDMLGRAWDGKTKITEEDESAPKQIKPPVLAGAPKFGSQLGKNDGLDFGPPRRLTLADDDFGRLSFDDDDDDDWARDDENTLSNPLSPPSSTNSRRVSPTLRQALRNVSGSRSSDHQRESLGDRPRSSIFDWSEPSIHDKHDAEMQRPKTAHGKQELDLRGGRPSIRKPPGAAHVRSQSVPVVPDPLDGSKPPPKFGTWGLGSRKASEDWDDDFEFDGDDAVTCSPGAKDSATSFSMVVPASIQAAQPSVKAHSGQIRELSLLVNDLKRLCRHGKQLDILKGPAAAKWAEAQSIIALASPDEDELEVLHSTKPSVDLDRSGIDDRFLEEGFDGPLLDHADDAFGFPEPDISKTAVIRERHVVRRRSVFSPDDDIFGGNWPLAEERATPARPRTPDRSTGCSNRSSTVISTVIEVMQQQQRQQRSASQHSKNTPIKTPDTKLFFDTNSLQELVKRASQLRDALSDVVRRAELLTQSPASTPRRERHSRHNNPDGSPAFTRVFVDPGSSPPRRLPNSRSRSSMLSKTSVESPMMQMMTVS